MIYTDAKGRPFDKPEPPPPGRSIEEAIAYLRARSEWSNAIADCANAAFDDAFRKAVRS